MTRLPRTITTPFGKRFFFCLWLFGASGLADAAEHCPEWVAKLASVEGRVEMQRSGQLSWQAAPLNARLCPGDRLRTGGHSRALLVLRDETFLRLDQKTTLLFSVPEEKTTSWLELFKGLVYFLSREPRRLEIRTPFVNAAIKGTEFLVKVTEARAEVSVLEGEVLAANRAGRLRLTEGQKAVAERGQAPIARLIVRPKDAVQWALYYPPLIDVRTVQAPSLQKALADYLQGDILGALDRLDRVPQQAQDAPYFTLKAALLMSVGRIDEARPALARAVDLEPANATAYALESIIAVARSEKAKALRLAHRAVKLKPTDPISHIALSYAQQAHFAIEKALKSLEKAVQLAPDNALAWARLSELALSRGNLDKSLKAAQRAAALEPDLARTQAVLGFAYLMQTQIEKARIAFQKAIRRESAAPLPRLGLGLAKIRQGRLKAGREAIEIAATLDPANALIRSYLGKAYFEEKRGKLAQTEFFRAKELDPKDPTPWFYEAIYQQTINRPVDALHAMQTAIELNDNRAVYRSRLLLDEDLAGRAVSLARIFENLEFRQLAINKSSKSLAIDPSNHSAHRFLSDTYSQRPRHEAARISELLQSQLLQPININPVQPELAETDLNLFFGTSPARAGFNEFTPLFERDGLQLIGAGIVGNHNTYADQAVLSGIHKRLSYSLGQLHYETDGFRENNEFRHNLYNVFAQASLTHALDLQFEYRRRETDEGDLRLNFEPNNFSRILNRSIKQDLPRLGLRFAPGPQSDLILSFIYADRREELIDHGPSTPAGQPTLQELIGQDSGYDLQAQYLYRAKRFNIALGAGAYDTDGDRQTRVTLDNANRRLLFRAKQDLSGQWQDIYLYSNISFLDNLWGTLGVSYVSFEDDHEGLVNFEKINPKFGLQWNLFDRLRLRLAAMQTVKRSIVFEQTLEPTQLAGFNQFFEDFNGTIAKRYGIGLDMPLTETFFGGIEFSRRDLDVPRIFLNARFTNPPEGEFISTFKFEEQREDLYRAYLYWTPQRNWAISVEYQLERLRREPAQFQFENGSLLTAEPVIPTEVWTTAVPFSVHYFNPSGFFATVGATYVRQKVGDIPDTTIQLAQNRDDFFVVNASVGYRLPKRWGIISLDVKNLFDENFRYQDINIQTPDPSEPVFIPDRTIAGRILINF